MYEDQNYNTWAKSIISAVVVLHTLSFFLKTAAQTVKLWNIYTGLKVSQQEQTIWCLALHIHSHEKLDILQHRMKWNSRQMYTGEAICAETNPWMFDPDWATDKFKMTLWHPTSHEVVIRRCFCVCDDTLLKVPCLEIWKQSQVNSSVLPPLHGLH